MVLHKSWCGSTLQHKKSVQGVKQHGILVRCGLICTRHSARGLTVKLLVLRDCLFTCGNISCEADSQQGDQGDGDGAAHVGDLGRWEARYDKPTVCEAAGSWCALDGALSIQTEAPGHIR